jgi:C4-dicarboxylate-specific signal transduction histidine kinase
MIQLSFDYYQEMSALEKNLAIIKKSYVKSLAVSMWNMQSSQLKTALDGIVNIPGIQYAAIIDNQMRLKLSSTYDELNILNRELEDKVLQKTELIIQQRQQLEYSSKMSTLGEMAGGIAHEINNPITMISLSNRLIRKLVQKQDMDSAKLGKLCDDIDNTVVRITKITTGLRIVSRDASEEKFAPAKLSEIFDDVLSLCGEKFKKNGVNIRIDSANENFQSIINCCRVQLSQVFLNLLGNSYDAIEALEERWIEIRCEKNAQNLTIKLIDSGNGIPSHIKEKIFLPFFTTKKIGKGTGLGLSLSHSIIKNHQGSFSLDESMENTCFVIILPLHGVENAQAS